MLELFLSISMLCSGGDCIPVAYGPDTKPGDYPLTEYQVPVKDQAAYGPIWYQIGDDAQWGIHGWKNFGKWMTSHGCIRVNPKELQWLKDQHPTSIRIIGPNKYSKRRK